MSSQWPVSQSVSMPIGQSIIQTMSHQCSRQLSSQEVVSKYHMMIIVEKRKDTINKVSNIREVPTKMMFKKNRQSKYIMMRTRGNYLSNMRHLMILANIECRCSELQTTFPSFNPIFNAFRQAFQCEYLQLPQFLSSTTFHQSQQ